MGKMGKPRKTWNNSRTRKTTVNTRQSATKKSCSENNKCMYNSTHALQNKYKNILGCKQPIIVLERCSVLENISHLNCFQVSSENSVNNTCDANNTRKLVYSTNHVSHQSPCIEKITNLESVHNLKVDCSKSLNKRPKQAAVKKIYNRLDKVSSNTNVSKNVSETSSAYSNRNTLSTHKSFIPKTDKSDSTSGSDKMMGANNSTNIATEDVVRARKRTKIYIRPVDTTSTETDSVDTSRNDFSINGTLITDTKNKEDSPLPSYLDLTPLQEKFVTKESTKSEDNISSLCTGNSCSSTLILQTPENLNATKLQEKLIVPCINELSKHPRLRTRKSIIIEDTEKTLSASTRKFIDSSTNTIQSSGKLMKLRSNDSKKQTKESTKVNIQESIKVKEKISKVNNIEYDASHHQDEQKSLRRQKRVHSENSNSSQDVKKIKLNRANWRNRLEVVNKATDTSNEVDKTEKTVESNNNEEIPQLIHTVVPGPSFRELDYITSGVQVAKANLIEEQGVSSIEKQNSTETFGYSNRAECNERKDARKSQQKTMTENHIPVLENTSFIAENRYFNNSQGDEDDCISLFADSMLIEEYNVPEAPQSRRVKEAPQSRRSKEAPLVTEKQYVMTDNVIDNYYKKNALEFNEAYNVNYFDKSKTQIIPQKEKPVKIVSQRDRSHEIVPKMEKPTKIVSQRERPVKIVPKRNTSHNIVPHREKPVEIAPRTKKPDEIVPLMKVRIPIERKDIISRLTLNPQIQTQTQNGILSLFRGFCYRMIRTGICYGNICYYKHNFVPFLMQLYKTNETRFFEVMDHLIQQQHGMFLKYFYKECIRSDTTNLICVLKLLKKFHTANFLIPETIYDCIKEMITYRITVHQIVDNLVNIVDASDTQFVTSMSKILVTYLVSGNGWPTLKPLFMKIDKLQEDIVQLILLECILTHKHIQDVYKNVVCKLNNESLTLFNKKLLLQFHSILRQEQENVEIKETVTSTSVTISSPNPHTEPEIIPYTAQTDNLSPKVWKDVVFDNKNNVQGGNSTVLLQPIDNISSAYSKHSRERFWKFYLDVHSLQEGLKHNDYRHVKKILDEAQRKYMTPFTTACYNILRGKVEHSQTHLSKLASLAVQVGATATFFKILIDVSINILANLAEKELWILALLLLNTMENIIHERCRLFKFDAAVTMLFCEIYLANRKPMKAFTLLKQSNILSTYRGKWKVRNNEKDDYIRAQIVTILLDMFCDTSLEYAFSLFEFLIVDQSSNFYPIDLSHQANKLVSLLLLKNDHELIINVGKLIDNYNFTLCPITHRALISSLVHINLPLAKQLYQNAVLLGIYSQMQFYPTMNIIVKSDWTAEEMRLAIWAMMHKLLENLGHAIEGLKPRNLSLYLVFEATPSGKQHVNGKWKNKDNDTEIKESINLMKNVLATEFDPPLFIVQHRKGKLQKMNSMSLYNYLQSNQN